MNCALVSFCGPAFVAVAGLLAVVVLPMARLLQRVGDLFGHIGLVVFGKDSVSSENAGTVERAFGDDALPFAEQIGQHTLIGDRDLALAVGDFETHGEATAAHQTAVLDQAAETNACTRPDMP